VTATVSCPRLVQLVLRHGVTSVHTCENGTWSSFRQLDRQRRLPVRVFYSACYHGGGVTDRCDDQSGAGHPTAAAAAGSTDVGGGGSEMLSCDRVKLFVDGALGAATAALSQPYRDSSVANRRGILRLTQVSTCLKLDFHGSRFLV